MTYSYSWKLGKEGKKRKEKDSSRLSIIEGTSRDIIK